MCIRDSSLGTDKLGYTIEAGGRVARGVTQLQAWGINKVLHEYVALRQQKRPPGAGFKNPVLNRRNKLRSCNTPLQWRKLVKDVFPASFRLKCDLQKHNVIDDEKVSNPSFPPASDLVCHVKGDNRPGALFRLKEKVHIRPGQTKKVDVYYPQPTADRNEYVYLVEAADEEGKVRDLDEELQVDVLQGVLPLSLIHI